MKFCAMMFICEIIGIVHLIGSRGFRESEVMSFLRHFLIQIPSNFEKQIINFL
jgi:hypothetical protein